MLIVVFLVLSFLNFTLNTGLPVIINQQNPTKALKNNLLIASLKQQSSGNIWILYNDNTIVKYTKNYIQLNSYQNPTGQNIKYFELFKNKIIPSSNDFLINQQVIGIIGVSKLSVYTFNLNFSLMDIQPLDSSLFVTYQIQSLKINNTRKILYIFNYGAYLNRVIQDSKNFSTGGNYLLKENMVSYQWSSLNKTDNTYRLSILYDTIDTNGRFASFWAQYIIHQNLQINYDFSASRYFISNIFNPSISNLRFFQRLNKQYKIFQDNLYSVKIYKQSSNTIYTFNNSGVSLNSYISDAIYYQGNIYILSSGNIHKIIFTSNTLLIIPYLQYTNSILANKSLVIENQNLAYFKLSQYFWSVKLSNFSFNYYSPKNYYYYCQKLISNPLFQVANNPDLKLYFNNSTVKPYNLAENTIWRSNLNTQILFLQNACINLSSIYCGIQEYKTGILLDYNTFHAQYKTSIKIEQKGLYQLIITWLPVYHRTNDSSIGIWINGVSACNFTTKNISYASSFGIQINSYVFQAQISEIFIKLKSIDTKINLNGGQLILNISLIQILQKSNLTSLVILNSTTVQYFNKVPNGRILFKFIAPFFRNLDRLNFYYLHYSTLIPFCDQFFEIIANINQQKGQLFQQYIYKNIFIFSFIQHSINNLSIFKNQTYYFYNTSNQQINLSFVYKYQTSLIFNIITSVAIFNIFYLIFYVSRKYKFSLYFRKFCFKLLIFLMMFQGNVQQMTFYYFNQLQKFFSFNFSQKICNTLIIFSYFILLIYITGIIFVIYFLYFKKIKYLFEQLKKQQIINFIFYIHFQLSFFPFLFGIVHSLFINNFLLLSSFLITIQILFIIAKILFVSQNNKKISKLPIFSTLMSSFLRIILLTIFVSVKNNKFIALHNNLNFIIIALYLSNDLLILFFVIILQFFKKLLMIFNIYKQQKNIVSHKNFNNIFIINKKSQNKLPQKIQNQNKIQNININRQINQKEIIQRKNHKYLQIKIKAFSIFSQYLKNKNDQSIQIQNLN